MTNIYHATPYDISATGFYFEDAEDYQAKAKALTNGYGDPVEEFEIDFIDGEIIDCELFKAWGVSQCDFHKYLAACENWDEDQKIQFIIAVDEGLFGEIPEHLAHYIDYDAIAHDLSMDYTQTTINNQPIIYRAV